ncbi:hypothetical protein QUF94_06035 [Peribacillus sp. NJ4]|nr:hypothetical protein [Peribacillus sp. NJ4]MDM5210994.1 hypothetical protein [Peribacillus sp. NJ4]
MSKKIGSARIAPSVNPQGHGKDVEFSTEPTSKKVQYKISGIG